MVLLLMALHARLPADEFCLRIRRQTVIPIGPHVSDRGQRQGEERGENRQSPAKARQFRARARCLDVCSSPRWRPADFGGFLAIHAAGLRWRGEEPSEYLAKAGCESHAAGGLPSVQHVILDTSR